MAPNATPDAMPASRCRPHGVRAEVSCRMPVGAARVFEVLHDYDRRLEWDALLCEARLTRGHVKAAKGATSLCVGRPLWGLIGVETRYITFNPGVVAAVELINRPPFFNTFAASIRHEDQSEGSLLSYLYRFTARPVCVCACCSNP